MCNTQPRPPLCPSASPRAAGLLPLAVPVPTPASHPLEVPSCHPLVVPTIRTTSKPVTLVQDYLPSVKLAGMPPGGPWLPQLGSPARVWGGLGASFPGGGPVSGVAIDGSPEGDEGLAAVLSGRPCSRGGRVLGAAVCEPRAMCARRRAHDSFPSSFSPHKIFILVVQGPVIAISHPELFIPCTD